MIHAPWPSPEVPIYPLGDDTLVPRGITSLPTLASQLRTWCQQQPLERLQFNTDNLAEKRISGIDFNVDMRLVYPTSVHAMSTSQLDIACTKENTEYLLAGWSSGLTFKTMCLSIILQVVRGSWGKTFSILPFFPENAIGEGLLTSRLSVNKLGQTHIALYAGNKGGLQFTHYSL